MAGYSSDDGDYYSDGGWGEEDSGGYYSDDQSDYDNVSESHEGAGGEDNHEEQDDDEGSRDENKGKCRSMFTVVLRSSTGFLACSKSA